MINNKILNVEYDCKNCTKRDKQKNGCLKEKKRAILLLDCICHDTKKGCAICNKGKIKIFRCPRLSDPSISRVYKYFQNWLITNQYPDGKGLYHQPIKLIKAFEILLEIQNRYQEKKKDK